MLERPRGREVSRGFRHASQVFDMEDPNSSVRPESMGSLLDEFLSQVEHGNPEETVAMNDSMIQFAGDPRTSYRPIPAAVCRTTCQKHTFLENRLTTSMSLPSSQDHRPA